ncbi:MAG TPA: sulfite exporter TauE/SafE family protein [Anaerolineae bacterium]
MILTPEQWLIGILAALVVGLSKTGLPGIGILVVPLMAAVFGGRLGVGATLPLLIFGDVFAVLWYHHHARWDKLGALIPWVLLGIAVGTALLWYTGSQGSTVDWLNIIIGVMVLLMLALNLARLKWGDRMVPSSRLGLISTGTMAGFSTTVSNAAGPIMSIYLTGMGLPKKEFMGTTAWYFFIFNLTKLPIYAFLSVVLPGKPMVNSSTILFDLAMLPVIIIAAFAGKWLLPRVSQTMFNTLVLFLAAAAAIKLILDQIH